MPSLLEADSKNFDKYKEKNTMYNKTTWSADQKLELSAIYVIYQDSDRSGLKLLIDVDSTFFVSLY